MPIQILKEFQGNYVRNCWEYTKQRGLTTTNRGNCIIRTPTRRRHTACQFLMLQTPRRSQPEVRRIAYKTWAQHHRPHWCEGRRRDRSAWLRCP